MSHILIVDDESDVAEALCAVLELEGYEVSVVGDGAACLRFLGEQRPDLVLLDLMMPVLNGFQVLDAMQDDALRDVPVIMMSAARPERVFSEPNVRAFLKKPFELQGLLDTIEQALRPLPSGVGVNVG